MKAILINGGVHGPHGNTAHFLRHMGEFLEARGVRCPLQHLVAPESTDLAVEQTLDADMVVLGTGTYWDSWGSPLQKYLEALTDHELSPQILGKPAAVLVTMDSVGGSSVAFRLQGVLSSMGFLIPPLSAIVLSRTGAMVRHPKTQLAPGFSAPDDVWAPEDLDVVAANLVAAKSGGPWARWPIASSARPQWPK